jgi:hypothetical protein
MTQGLRRGPRPVRGVAGRDSPMLIRVDGVFKNRVIDAAEEAGLSLNALIALAVKGYLDGEAGIPEAPRGVRPIPTVAEVIRDYINPSAEKLIGPCGRAWPCEADSDVYDVGGVGFCGHCDIRVS